LIIKTQSVNDPDDLEEIVYDPEGDVWDDKLVADHATTLGYLASMRPPSIDVDGITCQLSVVRCTLAQPKDSHDRHRSTIFRTLTKIMTFFWVIIDSESCVNAVTANMVTKFGLKAVPYPKSY